MENTQQVNDCSNNDNEAEQNGRNVFIIWDIENVRPLKPKHGGPSIPVLVKAIKDLAKEHGRIKEFICFFAMRARDAPDSVKVPFVPLKDALKGQLQEMNVIVEEISSIKPESADKFILTHLLKIALEEGQTPYTILLISGDRDFSRALALLGTHGKQTILVHNGFAVESLRTSVTEAIDFKEFIAKRNLQSPKIEHGAPTGHPTATTSFPRSPPRGAPPPTHGGAGGSGSSSAAGGRPPFGRGHQQPPPFAFHKNNNGGSTDKHHHHQNHPKTFTPGGPKHHSPGQPQHHAPYFSGSNNNAPPSPPPVAAIFNMVVESLHQAGLPPGEAAFKQRWVQVLKRMNYLYPGGFEAFVAEVRRLSLATVEGRKPDRVFRSTSATAPTRADGGNNLTQPSSLSAATTGGSATVCSNDNNDSKEPATKGGAPEESEKPNDEAEEEALLQRALRESLAMHNSATVTTPARGEEGSERPDAASTGGSAWSCKACTFINDASAGSCDMCNTPNQP